ncbi:MAG: SDR family NAD(P)-dependent oxidoreductase [Saprospiraceae bacterium]|nr:SDR family NAD(P)-dependent oxidoreductase [Saprospiraceae bacterium]
MSLIIIIGSGPGISRAVAKKFGSEGYTIALISRSEEKLKEETEALMAAGVSATFIAADAGNKEELDAALDALLEKYGRPEMMLFNASTVSVKDILHQDWKSMQAAMDICAGGYMHMMQWALPYCLEQNTGKLFATGGGLALQGDPQWTSASMGKAAMRNLVQAVQKRVKDTHIHVAQLTVCGYVTPADPKYNAETIADIYWKLYNQKPGEFENEIIY